MNTHKHTRAARNLTRPLPTVITRPTIPMVFLALATFAVIIALITALIA